MVGTSASVVDILSTFVKHSKLFTQNVTAIKIMYQLSHQMKAFLESWSILDGGKHFLSSTKSFSQSFREVLPSSRVYTQRSPFRAETRPRKEEKNAIIMFLYFALIGRGGRGEENVDPFSGLNRAGINKLRLQWNKTFMDNLNTAFPFHLLRPAYLLRHS